MRKIFYASALFVAAIAVGCGNNQKPAADANGVTDSLEQMDTTGVAASVSESEVKENIASGINNLKTTIPKTLFRPYSCAIYLNATETCFFCIRNNRAINIYNWARYRFVAIINFYFRS